MVSSQGSAINSAAPLNGEIKKGMEKNVRFIAIIVHNSN